MVETPGTAPGSDPLITSAFMFIVPKDFLQIRERGGEFNTWSWRGLRFMLGVGRAGFGPASGF